MKTRPARCAAVFAALLVLTGLTVGVSLLDLGALGTAIALSVASAKAGLVLVYFMDFARSGRVVWIAGIACVLWLGILITLALSDVLTRGWPA